MPHSTCPACGTGQPTPDGVAGFRCKSCQMDVRRIICRKCRTPCSVLEIRQVLGQLSSVARIARARNVVAKQQLRSINADVRRAVRVSAASQRQRAASDREARALYVEAGNEEVEYLNAKLQRTMEELASLLVNSSREAAVLTFNSLRVDPDIPTFDPEISTTEEDPPDWAVFLPPEMTGLERLRPGSKRRREEQMVAADEAYQEALLEYENREQERREHLAQAQREFDSAVEEIRATARVANADIDLLERQYRENDPSAVDRFLAEVIESEHLPEGFPTGYRLAYAAQSRQLVVELDLPGLESIPEVREYRYVKSRDEITKALLPATNRKKLYASVVAQLCLRLASAIFRADSIGAVDTIAVNGHVKSVDARTGSEIYPCIVSVRATRERFASINLESVDPVECLKGLNATFSRSPAELVPVRPILDFDMADSRFVEESDVLSSLDERPNLMDLTPGEFESLITNLFEKMGLETRLTQASRDGGVDCVAYDPRPIFGGKVVIQAKRYKNTVGVSAVRDLFGTMQNEGASKGILVTTSGYGQASHDFANGKPLELLDGGNLLYLLKQYAEIDAKIEPPEDWVDPILGL